MKILLHIGLEHCGAERVQSVLSDKRNRMLKQGVLFPRAPGRKNHTRLFMAVTQPDLPDPLRIARGAATPGQQAELRARVIDALQAEIAETKPHTVILSSHQLGSHLVHREELVRLHDLLRPLSDHIHIIAHIDEQARALTRHYASAIVAGRTVALDQEIELAKRPKEWAETTLEMRKTGDVSIHEGPINQAPPFWLDYQSLRSRWQDVFGENSVTFHPYDYDVFYGPEFGADLAKCFGLSDGLGWIGEIPASQPLSAATLTRGRILNTALPKVAPKGSEISGRMRRLMIEDMSVEGAPIAPGSLSDLSKAFEPSNAALVKEFPALKTALKRDRKTADWCEADPSQGFRISQYLTVFLPRLKVPSKPKPRPQKQAAPQALSPAAQTLLSADAKANLTHLSGGPMAPHNRLGRVKETALAPDYASIPKRKLAAGNTGNVIVACMKNEAPYILEWVAYHRAIGVDNFLIYTNDCSDGTAEILDRLQELGILQHRDNTEWKGNSPQQHALNRSLKEPLIQNAEWIIHIDVDEFINVRCGNGTLADFYAAVPDATNVAMTWRLFGHNDIVDFRDDLVIDQFDRCAPSFCPKPHTVWGFKSMFRNIGAYQKISCHRPNKLEDDFRDNVKWVNGSGQRVTEVLDNGWRSSVKSIGYDLIQLNHYALRSAESFLIKRQRGRALHVDRSIGFNYWVRMDWSAHSDLTIKRNIPRVLEQLAELRNDPKLLRIHNDGVAWHQAKAAELRASDEFKDLLSQTQAVKLTDLERVAFALSLEVDD